MLGNGLLGDRFSFSLHHGLGELLPLTTFDGVMILYILHTIQTKREYVHRLKSVLP